MYLARSCHRLRTDVRYITVFTCAIGSNDHSVTRRICAKLHDMSTSSAGAEWAGVLLEDAIAVTLLGEMKAQRYTATEIQKRASIKPRSWGNYYVNRSREIPTWAWVSTGAALGLDAVEVVRRARVLVESLTHTQSELLSGLSGRTRIQMLQEIAGGGVTPPKGRHNPDVDDGAMAQTATL